MQELISTNWANSFGTSKEKCVAKLLNQKVLNLVQI